MFLPHGRMMRAAALGVALIGLQINAGCSGAEPDRSPESIHVVVSTTVIADWVAEVGGDTVQLTTLVPPGSDAHTMQLSPGKVRAIANADLIIVNGAGLEASFEQALGENASVPILDLSQAIDLEHSERDAHEPDGDADGHDSESDDDEHHDDRDAHAGDADGHDSESDDDKHHGGHHGGLDPHFWLDASLAAEAIHAITAALAGLLPDQADAIEERRDAYLIRLEIVDAELLASLGGLIDKQRVLVTLHDAYGYFAQRYGLEIVGFVVEGPEEDPSAEDIAALVDEIRRRGITRIYAEPQFTARVLEQIADETGTEIGYLVSLPNAEVPNYLAMLRINADAILQPR